MPRYKITVTEINEPDHLVLGEPVSSTANTVLFEQTFDDLNLRSFVRQLNATPKRRKSKEKVLA